MHDGVLSSMIRLQKLSFLASTPKSLIKTSKFNFQLAMIFQKVSLNTDTKISMHLVMLLLLMIELMLIFIHFHINSKIGRRSFQIIARNFPFIQRLLVSNHKEQQVKYQSITFSHLYELCLGDSHTDCAREFLFNEMIALPCLTNLWFSYQTLATVTNSFTHNQARRICNYILIQFNISHRKSSLLTLCFRFISINKSMKRKFDGSP